MPEFERGVSRVRRTFAKRTKFFDAKFVDTFDANRSRQVPPTTNKREWGLILNCHSRLDPESINIDITKVDRP